MSDSRQVKTQDTASIGGFDRTQGHLELVAKIHVYYN